MHNLPILKTVLLLFILASCGVSTSSSSEISSPSSPSTTSTTTSSSPSTSSTITTSSSPSTSSTTTSSSSSTSSTSTSSTSPINGITDNAFEFALSTNRLQSVDFNISLDELVSSTQPLSRRQVDNGPRNSHSPGTTVIDTVNDTITYSNIPDSSNIGGEFRNLNMVITSIADSARNKVEWAVDQLSLTNTWVSFGQEKYLLQYDYVTDIVSLSVANISFVSANDNLYSLKHITVQYTEQGDLLVEVYEALKQFEFASFLHLRFIKGSLYELSSDIWANGVREAAPMAGGPGWFKAVKNSETDLWMYWRSTYFNASFNVQTPSGWIQTSVRIAPEASNPSDDIARFNKIKVASGGLENDVFTFELNNASGTLLNFYPAAFTGWSTIQAPYSSVEVKNLQDWTSSNPNVAVYGTTSAKLVVDVLHNFDDIPTTIRPQNIDDLNGDGYVGYVAESRLSINSNYRTMLPDLLVAFNSYGLGYKHGDITNLLTDVTAVTNNLNRLFNQFELNDVSGFSKLETLRDVVVAEMDLITALADTFTPLMTSFPTMTSTNLPPVVLNADDLLPLSGALTGAVTFNTETHVITTENLSVTLQPSVLLTADSDYTLAYGWFADGYVMPIEEETPVTYNGTTWSLTGGSTTLDVVPSQPRTYQLVTYLVKVVGEKSLRISSYAPVTVAAFSETVVTLAPSNGFEPTLLYTNDNGLFLTVSYTDIQGPTITFPQFQLSFSGTLETNVLSLALRGDLTISTFAQAFTLTDNLDTSMLFDLSQLTWNDGVIESVLDIIQFGTYTLTIVDLAGNETVLTVIFSQAVS